MDIGPLSLHEEECVECQRHPHPMWPPELALASPRPPHPHGHHLCEKHEHLYNNAATPADPSSKDHLEKGGPSAVDMGKVEIELQKNAANTPAMNGDDGKEVEYADVDPTKEEEEEEEEGWGNKTQFLLACIGLAVGLGNVWRFPMLLHENGGGAFLVPYIIMLFLEGVPIMYVEMAIGQYFRGGSVVSWERIHPSLKGIGLCSLVISSFLCIYYVMVIAWILYYMWVSLESVPPYAGCEYTNDICCTGDNTLYYWYTQVLKASPSISDFGAGPSWELIVFLILAWIVTYLCVFQGVKSTGKAAYFAATFPYICLFILLIKGLTLPGAGDGLKKLFTPQFSKLASPTVWIKAATQIFFSLSLGFGALVAFASFMPYKNNITRDTMIVAVINSFTSILAGICIYSILGFRAHETGRSLDEVSYGAGLTFVAITEAVSRMDGTPFFAFVFFFMLFNLGVSSQFGTLAGLVTPLYNDLKIFGKARKELCVAFLAVVFLGIGIIFTPGNGQYILDLFNNYPVTMPLLVVSIAEAVSVGWIFGIENFDLAIRDMTGAPCPKYFKICIKYISPVLMIFLLGWTLIDSMMNPQTYDVFTNCNPDDIIDPNRNASYTENLVLPESARVAGGLMVTLCTVPVAVYACWKHLTAKEFWQCIYGTRQYAIGEMTRKSTNLAAPTAEPTVKVNYAVDGRDDQDLVV